MRTHTVARGFDWIARRVQQGARYGLVNELSHALNAPDIASRGADTIYTYTNTGPCVDLWAPGVDVYSACGGRHRCGQYTPSSDSSYAWASGTSMVRPRHQHVYERQRIELGLRVSLN